MKKSLKDRSASPRVGLREDIFFGEKIFSVDDLIDLMYEIPGQGPRELVSIDTKTNTFMFIPPQEMKFSILNLENNVVHFPEYIWSDVVKA